MHAMTTAFELGRASLKAPPLPSAQLRELSEDEIAAVAGGDFSDGLLLGGGALLLGVAVGIGVVLLIYPPANDRANTQSPRLDPNGATVGRSHNIKYLMEIAILILLAGGKDAL